MSQGGEREILKYEHDRDLVDLYRRIGKLDAEILELRCQITRLTQTCSYWVDTSMKIHEEYFKEFLKQTIKKD